MPIFLRPTNLRKAYQSSSGLISLPLRSVFLPLTCLSSSGLPLSSGLALFLMRASLPQACLLFLRPASPHRPATLPYACLSSSCVPLFLMRDSLPQDCLSSSGLPLFLRPISLLQACRSFIRPSSISVLHPLKAYRTHSIYYNSHNVQYHWKCRLILNVAPMAWQYDRDRRSSMLPCANVLTGPSQFTGNHLFFLGF